MTELDRIEEEFGNPIDLEEVVDEVYSEAPFKFQESFLDLRRSLRTATKRTEIIVRNAGEGLVKPRFERAIILFPESDFPRLKSITRQYQRLMRYSLAGGDPGVGYADRFTTEYWQVFCYFLRIHERGHFNVSQARLDYWGRVASEYLSASGPKMNAIAEEMIGTLDSSIDPLDRACLIGADWGKGSERTSIEVHSLVY
ncbi:MAG: hypothetical protein JRN51_09440 [Nitrososphaerota archaeon]|nr:hypothetical protein [Nitrososphaerota archaeon]